MDTTKTPAVHPLTALSKDWLAYVIGTRTEEGAIEVISMALERKAAEHARMRAALEKLVRINEEHNEAIAKVMGKPLGWKDDYLNEAREVLASLTT